MLEADLAEFMPALSEGIRDIGTALRVGSPPPSDEGDGGIRFSCVDLGEGLYEITWRASSGVRRQAREYLIQFLFRGSWETVLSTREASSNGLPIHLQGFVDEPTCLRMIATRNGALDDPILGEGRCGC